MSVFLDLKKSVPTFIDKECGIISNESFHKIYREDFIKRVFNITCVVFREFTYLLKAAVKNTILINNSKSYATLPADTQNSGLVICFHGLNGRPSVWNGHIEKIEELNKKGENIVIYTPTLPRLGHVATNDNEVQQIYNTILSWVKNNRGKPITVFGQSNGCRFALALEYYLREKAPKTPVNLSMTGGVFYGTSKINQMTKRISTEKLEKYTLNFITVTACNELTLGSEPSKKLLKNARKPLLNNVAERRYCMYGSPNDQYVPEHGSSLSLLCSNENNPQKNEKHYFVPGYGHNSLVDSVVDKQISKMIHFFKRKNSNRFDKMHCKHCHKIKGFVLNIDDSTQKIKLQDNRLLIKRIGDKVKACFNFLDLVFVKLHRKRSHKINNETFPRPIEENEKVQYPQEPYSWNKSENSDGLYLFIHGLKGSPTAWDQYVDSIKKREPTSHIFCPQIYKQGNVSLERAAEPILDAVKDYTTRFRGKPIYLVGTSNGGRIALYIENHLAPDLLGTAPLRVVTISGVLNGTKFVDTIEKVKLGALMGLDPTLQKECKWKSEVAKNLLNEWKEKQKVWKKERKNVQHFFCASLDDEQVWPVTSSLPYSADATSNYKVYTGESHTSIVEGACKKVIKWLQNGKTIDNPRSGSLTRPIAAIF